MLHRLALLIAIGTLGLLVGIPTAAAGGGCHVSPTDGMTTGDTATLGIGECAFEPTVTYVEPGQKVTWVNRDVTPHTVTGAGYSWGTDRELASGARVTYAFKKDGVYPYYCAYHPAMVGAVVVGDATQAASLTGGLAAVDEVDSGSGGTGTEAPVSTNVTEPNTSIVMALGAFALIAIAAIAWRTLSVRRRASAAPAP